MYSKNNARMSSRQTFLTIQINPVIQIETIVNNNFILQQSVGQSLIPKHQILMS
jgi:hypothetical protein